MGGTLSPAEVRLALRLFLETGVRCSVFGVRCSDPPQRPNTEHRTPAVSAFEAAFAEAVEVPHAVSFGAGRVALWAILRALGIGAGDEVVVPGYTCVAVPNAVRFAGARPVYADIDPLTFNVSAATCSRVMTRRTRAIVVAHTYGLPAPMAELRELVEGRGIALIEDAAHALGSEVQGRKVGSLGDAAFFSTEHSKMISTALGGVATTADAGLADRLRAVQAQCPAPSAGRVRRLLIPHLIFGLCYRTRRRRLGEWLLFRSRLYRWAQWATPTCEHEGIEAPGYRWRMGEAQARLGLEQLRRLEGLTAARRSLAMQYAQSMLALGLPYCGLRIADCGLGAKTGSLDEEGSSLPDNPRSAIRNPQYGDRPVMVRFPYLSRRREALLAAAETRRLELGLWFEGPIHPRQTNLAVMGYTEGSCPVAEQVSRRVVNLPCHPGTTPEDVARYVELLAEVER